MPVLRHKKPKYCVDKSTGHAQVWINGKKVSLGKAGTDESYEKYDQVCDEYLRKRQEVAQKQEQSHLTWQDFHREKVVPKISELAGLFNDHAHNYYVKDGEVTREAGLIRDALKILVKLFGKESSNDFGPVKLRNVRNHMVEHPNGHGRFSTRKHVNKQVGRITRCFKWACEREIVDPGVYHSLTTLSGLQKGRCTAPDNAPVECVPDEIVDQTLPHLSQVVADMVRIQRLTACRPEEIRIMRPCDIDLDSHDGAWLYRPEKQKMEHVDGRERVIPIGPQAQAILLPYLERPKRKYCFSPIESYLQLKERRRAARKSPPRGNKASNKVPDRFGEMYGKDSYRQAIQRACKRHGIATWSPNQLRHTGATAIRANHGLEASQAVLGHAKADVTQIYADRDLKKAIDIALKEG